MTKGLGLACRLALLGAIAAMPLPAQSPLVLTRTIPLPGVEGRIDHMAIDLAGERLFVAALGNNSVEVVDLRSFAVTRSIRGLSEPQGVAYIRETGKLYVANAGTGECDVYDGSSFAVLRRIDLGGDADNMHYAAASHRLLVSAGDGLSFLDVDSDTLAGRVDLPGHPEGFAVEQSGPRVFVNVPLQGGRLFVVDRERALTVAQWVVGGENFPLCLNEADKVLFVGTRAPARLRVMGTEGGKVLADIGIDGDPDDVFWDAKRRAVYVSCGAGYIDVVPQTAPERYGPVTRIPTAQGARTSLWVPEEDRLLVAVPRGGTRGAEVRIYEPGRVK